MASKAAVIAIILTAVPAAHAQDTNVIERPIDEQEAAAIGRGSTFLVGGGVLWQAPATFNTGGDLS
ncbi:MAG: hypothetical protein RL005_1547, partial [Planctomycetota bacterium]